MVVLHRSFDFVAFFQRLKDHPTLPSSIKNEKNYSCAVLSLLFLTAFIQIKNSNKKMEPRFTTLTLGVDNLEKSYKFYHEGLGLASKGIVGKEFEHGDVAFFDLKNGMTLALYSRDNLAWDSQLKKSEPSSTEFSIGYNTRTEAEVDSIMEQAKK